MRVRIYEDRLSVAVDRSGAAYINPLLERVEAEARALVPVRTGRLRDSIRVTPFDNGVGRVGAYTGYATAVEFGTSRRPGRYYMTQAVERVFGGR